MNYNQIIIFKNDAVGDLTQSLPAINNIVSSHEDQKITIYLSERSKNFSFLIKGKNIIFKNLNYDLNFIDKIKLISVLIKNNIDKIFILSPKNFYFFLLLFFFFVFFSNQ